ncbi:DUF4286 family protein [Allorhizocola rhizosphaerae]|uniref:DUF4286 family protein n=1 Tax=Allorhizocola rhizosphaerae TaxID=1872709 RepID=UPI000E3C1600|nr:DUF4286 family protein [Allorhizocola rhizosphaerae]
MLIYSVRSGFDDGQTRRRYLDWLTQGHAQAVVEAGAQSAEIVSYDDGSVETRYLFASREAFAAYEAGPAVALRADGKARFPDVRSVRSVGEQISF